VGGGWWAGRSSASPAALYAVFISAPGRAWQRRSTVHDVRLGKTFGACRLLPRLRGLDATLRRHLEQVRCSSNTRPMPGMQGDWHRATSTVHMSSIHKGPTTGSDAPYRAAPGHSAGLGSTPHQTPAQVGLVACSPQPTWQLLATVVGCSGRSTCQVVAQVAVYCTNPSGRAHRKGGRVRQW
jgi:hypothetical protein